MNAKQDNPDIAIDGFGNDEAFQAALRGRNSTGADEGRRLHLDRLLDQALDASFPASDPSSVGRSS
jgi:hypothetical protein